MCRATSAFLYVSQTLYVYVCLQLTELVPGVSYTYVQQNGNVTLLQIVLYKIFQSEFNINLIAYWNLFEYIFTYLDTDSFKITVQEANAGQNRIRFDITNSLTATDICASSVSIPKLDFHVLVKSGTRNYMYSWARYVYINYF